MKLIYRCLCAVIGAILGSGCGNHASQPVEYGPEPEYGVPTGKVRLDGRVVSPGGTPIPGIQVTLTHGPADTTDAGGNWAIAADAVYLPCADAPPAACTVAATDIDGATHGGPYPDVMRTLSLTQTEPGSGQFDLGTWEQHGVDITMGDAVEYGPYPARLPPPDGRKR